MAAKLFHSPFLPEQVVRAVEGASDGILASHMVTTELQLSSKVCHNAKAIKNSHEGLKRSTNLTSWHGIALSDRPTCIAYGTYLGHQPAIDRARACVSKMETSELGVSTMLDPLANVLRASAAPSESLCISIAARNSRLLSKPGGAPLVLLPPRYDLR